MTARAKHALTSALCGFLSSLISGALFGFIGVVFAERLGFPATLGTEQIGMEASLAFFAILGVPIGAFVGTQLVFRGRRRPINRVFVLLTVFFLIATGLLLRDRLGLYTLVLFAACSSLTLSVVQESSAEKSEQV